jgi:cell division protein FtsN
MQINLDKKSGLLLGIIAGLLVVIIVLLVDKVGDEGNIIETQSAQLQIGN